MEENNANFADKILENILDIFVNPYANLFELLDKFTILIAFFTFIVVLMNWNSNKKQLKSIEIYFKIKLVGNRYILIENQLTRKDARRSEIQGILANKLIKGVTRYNIDYLGSDTYFKNIFELQNSKTDYIVIELENDELAQFADLIIAELNEKEICYIKKNINDFIEMKQEIVKKSLKIETIEKLNL